MGRKKKQKLDEEIQLLMEELSKQSQPIKYLILFTLLYILLYVIIQ